MKYLILMGLFSLALNNTYAADNTVVFPNADNLSKNNNCTVIRKPCSFDSTQSCIKKYCGEQINELYLENFVIEHKLKGKKFPSLFDLENYLKSNLPIQLRNMSINFVHRKNENRNYNKYRINVLLDSKDYISDLIIG